MALKLEFCNVIVPVKNIREKLGDDAFHSRFALITDVTWHDDHLFRDGCMNHYDLDDMLDEWEGWGFSLIEVKAGKKQWKDLCVVNSGQGPTYACEWIEYDLEKNICWLKGHPPGIAIGPASRKVAGET